MMHHEISTRALLKQLASGNPSDDLNFEYILNSFRQRSYGLFLLLVLLPVFIPIPAGQGAFSGLLTSLIGLQLFCQMPHPWVPQFIARKPFKRAHIINFQKRFDSSLRYVEKIFQPRWEFLFDQLWARMFSGALLLVLGGLLALPILFTNYPFGLVLLAFSLGFIERNGILLAIGWLFGLIEIFVIAFSAGYLLQLSNQFLGYFT